MKKKLITKSLIKNITLWLILFILLNIVLVYGLMFCGNMAPLQIIRPIVGVYSALLFAGGVGGIAHLIVDYFSMSTNNH